MQLFFYITNRVLSECALDQCELMVQTRPWKHMFVGCLKLKFSQGLSQHSATKEDVTSYDILVKWQLKVWYDFDVLGICIADMDISDTICVLFRNLYHNTYIPAYDNSLVRQFLVEKKVGSVNRHNLYIVVFELRNTLFRWRWFYLTILNQIRFKLIKMVLVCWQHHPLYTFDM